MNTKPQGFWGYTDDFGGMKYVPHSTALKLWAEIEQLRAQVASTHVPMYKGEPCLLTPEQRADFIRAANGCPETLHGQSCLPQVAEEEPLRVSGELPEGFSAHKHI